MNVGKESEYLENKESVSQKRKGLISLISMLNKHGRGTVYFGVSNGGDVLKVSYTSKTIMELRTEIRDYVKPAIVPEIELLEDENGNHFIKLSATGRLWPYSAYGEYRIRIGEEDCQLDPFTIRKMASSSINDLLKYYDSDIQNLHFSQFSSLLVFHGVKLGNEDWFAKNEGFVDEEGKFNLEGKLFSDENDTSMKVTRFEGVDKSKILTRNEFGYKSLAVSIQSVLSFMESMNQTKVVFENGVRKDISLFDFDGFREAFINACLHTRWQENTPPNVFVYSNRIQVTSFGGLPYGLSLDDFYAGRQMVINKGIQRVLFQLEYVEQKGYGVPYILNHFGKEAFSITDNFVDVQIPFNFNRDTKQMIAKPKPTESEKAVLDVLKENPYATRNEISLKTGLSSAAIYKIMKKWKENGTVAHRGSNKTGYWEILK